MNIRSLEEYLQLPYTIEIIRETDPDNPGWVARVVELPGCLTQADHFEELETMLDDAMRLWLEAAIEDNLPIPEPRRAETYSGKFVVRVPRSLHRQLAEASEREGVSLNSYCNYALSRSVSANDKPAVPVSVPEVFASANWPGFNANARRFLIAAGYTSEAGNNDERLIADWIENHIDQAQVAIQQWDIETALKYLSNLQYYFELFMDSIPIFQAYSKTVQLLIDQVIDNRDLSRGIVEQKRLEARISSFSQRRAPDNRRSTSQPSKSAQIDQIPFSENSTESDIRLFVSQNLHQRKS